MVLPPIYTVRYTHCAVVDECSSKSSTSVGRVFDVGKFGLGIAHNALDRVGSAGPKKKPRVTGVVYNSEFCGP